MHAPSIKFLNLAFFPSFFFELSVQISVKPAFIDNMFFWSFLLLCPFFVCQTWRTASLPFDATSSHAFACYCVEQQKRLDSSNYSLFLQRFVIELYLHAGHVWFLFFSFFCLKMSFFSRMTPAWHSYFICGLLTFLGQQQKSDRTSHLPHTLSTVCAFQLC